MDIKLNVLSFLRRLRLLKLADRIRYYMHKIKNGNANRKFKHAHPGFILPPPYFIYETYQLNYELYFSDGFVTAGELMELIKKHISPIDGNLRILDWGCGPGRITRHLHAHLPGGAAVYGTDYNPEYIQWCKLNIDGVNWRINAINPPLDFSSGYFNVVIGLSVFTHLSELGHEKWVDELNRICIEEAVVLLTTQGSAYKNKLSSVERKIFEEGKLVVRENILEGHRLFSSFHPTAYIRRLVQSHFDICRLIEGIDSKDQQPAQDIWILKKRKLDW